MNTSKIIKAYIGAGTYSTTEPITQGDYGYILQIEGTVLPATYRVDFANDRHEGEALPVYGNENGAEVPEELIATGKDIFAFYYYIGENFGKTAYTWKIPNETRAKYSDRTPTPTQQDSIDQLIVRSNEAVESAEQSASDASQSAQTAQGYAEQAETAKTNAQTYANNAQTSANNASASASASARSEENARDYAQRAEDALEEFTTPTASATTLPEGSNATASYADGNFDFGIPKGDTGESPVTLRLSKDVVYVPMDREYRTKIAITDNIYYEYRRGDEQIDGIMDYTGTLTNTNITCTNVQACTPTQRGYMRFTIPQGVPLRTNTDTQLVVNIRFVFDYTDLDGNRRVIARSIMFVGVMDGEQGEPGAKGEPGDDGYSPTVTITPITGGHRIAITDVDGTKTADVMDGDDYILTEEDKEEIADIVEVPSDWLKAFPTDTASGSIASFSDGADNIPLKSLIVNIDPVQDTSSGDPSPENICPISGWTGANVSATGINIWDEEWEVGGISNGRNISETDKIRSKNYIPVVSGNTYFFHCKTNALIFLSYYDSDKNYLSSPNGIQNVAVTIPEHCRYIRFRMQTTYGTTYNHDISINYPSTDHDYHPYTGRSITINLGQTVYGGSLDVLSGELVVDRVMVDLGTLTYAVNNHTTLGQYFYAEITALRVKYEGPFGSILYNALCSAYKVVTRSPTYLVNGTFCFDGNITNKQVTQIQIKNTAYTDAATFKTTMSGVMLCYELATPIEIQLDAHTLNSLYGVNNLWADSGDTACEYRADTRLYIEKLTQPEEDDMVANSAIASGQFFMIGNSLYKALANIASGATITVGTNAQRVSLSDALNLVNT